MDPLHELMFLFIGLGCFVAGFVVAFLLLPIDE